MQASEVVENTQGLMDKSLLLEHGSTQTVVSTVQSRKEELVEQQQIAHDKIDVLKREISVGEREQKGISLFENNHVDIHDEEGSTVLSENGGMEYTVNKREGTCSCKDHEFTGKYGVICKHRIADKLARDIQTEEETNHSEKNKECDGGVTFAVMAD